MAEGNSVVRNSNKIVTITSNDSSPESEKERSWKFNLKRILTTSTISGNNNIFTTTSVADQFNVPPEVDLLMTETENKFGSNNKEPETPFADFIGGGGKFHNTAIGNVINLAIQGANALSALTDAGTYDTSTSDVFNPWFLNVPTWNPKKSAGGVSFSYTFNFAVGQYGLWNAKKEVVLPILNLVAPALPRESSSVSIAGPYPTTAELLVNIFADTSMNIITGSTETDFLDKDSGSIFESIGNALQGFILNNYPQYTFDVSFGKFRTIRQCLIDNVNINFSTDTDQDGYPISGSATVDFTSILPLSLTTKPTEDGDLRLIRFGVDNG